MHILAIVVYRAAKHHQLLPLMITGRKALPHSVPQPSIAGSVHALVLLGRSFLAVAALINFL